MRIPRPHALACAALSSSLALLSVTAQASETITYTYDAQGRLTNAAHSGTVNSTLNSAYTFDAADNRSTVTVTGASPPPTCTPGTANRYAITTGTTSWTVPAGVNCVTVYAIGAGGNGESRGATSGAAQGGGGGGFAKLNNYATTPGSSIAVQVAGAGSGAQTYWVNATTLLANAGSNGTSGTAGAGGALGVGDVTFAGGSAILAAGAGGGGGAAAGPDGGGKSGGGAPSSIAAGGGGGTDGLSSTPGVTPGAANGGAGGSGPTGTAGGAGAVSSTTSAQPGSNGSGGGGGNNQRRTGGAGSQYDVWAITAGLLSGQNVGPGSGGGGGGTNSVTGATGGNAGGYGGGGGGSRTGGSGTNGIIVVVY